jgi:hypothetical protein
MGESVTLKEYYDAILSEKDKAISAALAAQEKAAIVNKDEVQRWRDSANEWRGAMSDRERDFLTRKEFYAIIGTAISMITLFALLFKLFA